MRVLVIFGVVCVCAIRIKVLGLRLLWIKLVLTLFTLLVVAG